MSYDIDFSNDENYTHWLSKVNLCEVLSVNQLDENSVSGNDARSSSPE